MISAPHKVDVDLPSTSTLVGSGGNKSNNGAIAAAPSSGGRIGIGSAARRAMMGAAASWSSGVGRRMEDARSSSSSGGTATSRGGQDVGAGGTTVAAEGAAKNSTGGSPVMQGAGGVESSMSSTESSSSVSATHWAVGATDGSHVFGSSRGGLASLASSGSRDAGDGTPPSSFSEGSVLVSHSVPHSPSNDLLSVSARASYERAQLSRMESASSLYAGKRAQGQPPESAPSAQQQTKAGRNGGGAVVGTHRSQFQERLIEEPSWSVESVLAATCEALGFHIAEVWLRTGPKTHQLVNSHLRPTALEDSVRRELVDVYYGDRSSERTHRLSPALCKRAKEAMDVVWVTAHTDHGSEALRNAITSDVRTAVAVPVCHEKSNTNLTIIYFSIRRAVMRPPAVEFVVHMSLAAAIAAVNCLADDILVDVPPSKQDHAVPEGEAVDHFPVSSGAQPYHRGTSERFTMTHSKDQQATSLSEHNLQTAKETMPTRTMTAPQHIERPRALRARPSMSVTGARLDLPWSALSNLEYLTDGGSSWIHTAVMNATPVVVKTLKPECQDLALAISEIESELEIHAKLDHPNIVGLMGAGTTNNGSRFVVLERLDGGTLTQRLGYDTRIRDRRRRFWKRKQLPYLVVLNCARSIAAAMAYLHFDAIPQGMVLHRDLKPDNLAFTLDGTTKVIDFGLARILEGVKVEANDVYEMSGETGSLRYMAPEVADCRPYNQRADVYSFGIILWELVACKKPFDGLNREEFYSRVIHGGERPPIGKRWPEELTTLMTDCWSCDSEYRPNFREIVARLDRLLWKEKNGEDRSKRTLSKRFSGIIDRHSTWF